MKNAKEDRRVRRTQKLLKESLVELMSEKEFKDISIKEVTERADLNRGTFYLHYSDTYELLRSMENDVLNDFQELITDYLRSEQVDSLLPVLQPIVHYIVENREICTNLFENNSSGDFHREFKNLIHKYGAEVIGRIFPASRTGSSDYFFEFVTFGFIGIIRKWLNDGMPESEEEIARMGNDCVMAIAHKFF